MKSTRNSGWRVALVVLVIVIGSMYFMPGYFGSTTNFTSNNAQINIAEQSLRNLPGLKGKKLNLFRGVSFYDDGRIYALVQDPDTLSNVNSYTYHQHRFRAGWEGPYPYKLDKTDSPLENWIIPLDSISFNTAAKIVTTYDEKAAAVGSKQALGEVEMSVTSPHKWAWKYEEEIDGGTERTSVKYKILFKPDGSIKYFGDPNLWNFLDDSVELDEAEKELKGLPGLKGKRLYITGNIEFSDAGSILIDIQDPDTPENKIRYTYSSGEWSINNPGDIFVNDDDSEEVLKKKRSDPHYLFPLDSIHFGAVAKIASTYTTKARDINSSVLALDQIVFDASNPHKPVWKIDSILKDQKTGEKYKIEFNRDGSLGEFRRF